MVFIVLYQILFPISVIVSHTFLFCLADQFSDQDYNKDNNYKEEQADQHDHHDGEQRQDQFVVHPRDTAQQRHRRVQHGRTDG